MFDVTVRIEQQLATVADVNPLCVLQQLLRHFDSNKYYYTKHLLSFSEKEQIIDLMEYLVIRDGDLGFPLTALIDPNPLAIVENLLVFKLKQDISLDISSNTFAFSGTIIRGQNSNPTPVNGQLTQVPVIRDGQRVVQYVLKTSQSTADSQQISFTVDKAEGLHNFSGEVISRLRRFGRVRITREEVDGEMERNAQKMRLSYQVSSDPNDQDNNPSVFQWDIEIDLTNKLGELNEAVQAVKEYFVEIEQYQKEQQTKVVKDTVFLPTRGVFAEALLGRANGSEYINDRRFYNWQDSPIPNAAPTMVATDINQDRVEQVADGVQSTVPDRVINPIAPQAMPSANSLNAALQALQSSQAEASAAHAASLVSVLGSLADLAKDTAKAAGELSGDAAENALKSAADIGLQVASMVNKAMEGGIATPAKNPTEAGGRKNELDKLESKDGAKSATSKAKANSQGTPLPEKESE